MGCRAIPFWCGSGSVAGSSSYFSICKSDADIYIYMDIYMDMDMDMEMDMGMTWTYCTRT